MSELMEVERSQFHLIAGGIVTSATWLEDVLAAKHCPV